MVHRTDAWKESLENICAGDYSSGPQSAEGGAVRSEV